MRNWAYEKRAHFRPLCRLQQRFNRNGRLLGFKTINLIEIETKTKSDQEMEAQSLERIIPKGTTLIGLDEFGEQLNSTEFALMLRAVSYTHLTLPTIYSV